MGLPLNAQQMALFGADAQDPALASPQEVEPYGKINQLLNGMMARLTAQYGTDHLQAGSGELEETSLFRMDGVSIQATYSKPEGACLVLRGNEGDFLILAYETTLNITSADPDKPGLDFTLLEEGRFEKGVWQRGRRLNGDEAVGCAFAEPTLLHIRTFQYK